VLRRPVEIATLLGHSENTNFIVQKLIPGIVD